MRRFNSKKGYTLTEVVIVMLVVAVVVSVSIKITKAKLDNIVSYTYYSGYSTLKGVTSQMVKDFKASDQQYMAVPDLSAYNRIFMFRNALFPVISIEKLLEKEVMAYIPNSNGGLNTGTGNLNNGTGNLNNGTGNLNNGNENLNNGTGNSTIITHPECNYYYGGRPTCPDGQVWMDWPTCRCTGLIPSPDPDPDPDPDPTPDPSPDPTPDPPPCQLPSEEQKDARYCTAGEKFDASPAVCDWVNVEPWPPCVGDEYRWDVTQCKCVPEPITIPRSGQNFCEKFVSYSNTKSGSAECTGSKIDATLTDFSEQTPDITLRNGMRIYNIRQNPGEIADLANNTQGAAYDGVPNVNTYGYTVYIDIDGEKGSSTLWQDVYPFYITMAGKVIPAYDMASNADEVGGNSRQHLMTSIEKEGIDATGHRKLYWVSKSVSFKEGACASGYVGAQTNYCNGVALKDACSGASSSCVLKFVSPIKFFK